METTMKTSTLRERLSAVSRVLAYPAWQDNPYLNMLYLGLRSRGVPVSFVSGFERLLREISATKRGDILHVHWTQQICQGASDEDTAWLNLARFKDHVNGAVGRGVVVVWTIHNLIPHETRFREPELDLSRYLVGVATRLHVMSEETATVFRAVAELPHEKTVIVPHSSYFGIYEQTMTREAARASFGLSPNQKSVLFFGQMRSYKGLDLLIEACAQLHARSADVALLMAGKARPEELSAIDDMFKRPFPNIRRHGFIDHPEVPTWFAAADVVVVPYKDFLNSGTMFLAATFGVPVLLPGLPHVREQFSGQSWVLFFDPEGGASEVAAAIDAFEDPDGEIARDALNFARSYRPSDMSEDFAALIADIAVSESVDATVTPEVSTP
ncbi:peptidase M14 [Flavimobilis marinus]|uniref:Glycosyltransferase involved in cell wall bisynthesis n=1 Tax=Flavimobilis marinus TaxID=285351 RepID=A0A1I2GKJ1_9MICO|nr:glycosyltransferase family 4 protein [Flavimobilis marinus]GHG56133.1 peptidase M14 [Flavimobilis marinus]SFF18095.1 Glycosyltransferase involved in cell wall bisynthesis [Flavimobilis marinus]